MKPSCEFKDLIKNFAFQGIYIGEKPHGCGHINDTYAVCFKQADGSILKYILQRINSSIFKSPEKLMDNIFNITEYLKKIIIKSGGDPFRETLNIIPTIDGNNYYKASENDYWRAYIFIENATTYQLVENPIYLYNSGKAFGQFQEHLKNFPAETLHETIPNFHNTKKRYADFLQAIRDDLKGRSKNIQAEIDFVKSREKETAILVDLIECGSLPLKVTHNDTKFNNVMIDITTGEGICVIDLDTVMPGSTLYDFGDSIRSGASSALEDEVNLSKVYMDLNLFEHFAKGFLETAGKSLTKLEIEYLPFSAMLMTFECGIRFLTDYLNGDVYFKTHTENHNLDRARNQFKIVSDIESKYNEMKIIIGKNINITN